jgi:uncharacterized protein (DUF488 family)
MANTVYTLGYLQRGSMEQLRKLVADNVIVLDIRLSPRSAWLQWSRKQLTERFQSSYLHVPELGNVNYRSPDLPIQLQDEKQGLWAVRFWLDKGYDVCLLCVCAEVSACHRLTVAALVEGVCSCQVVHL